MAQLSVLPSVHLVAMQQDEVGQGEKAACKDLQAIEFIGLDF